MDELLDLDAIRARWSPYWGPRADVLVLVAEVERLREWSERELRAKIDLRNELTLAEQRIAQLEADHAAQ